MEGLGESVEETVRYLLTHREDQTCKDEAVRNLWHEKHEHLPANVKWRTEVALRGPEIYFDVIENKKTGKSSYSFSPVRMATDLLANEHFLMIGEERGERVILYHATDSIYRPEGENRIRTIMVEVLGDMAKIPTKHQIAEVVDKVRRCSIRWKVESIDNVDDLPLLNGVLNWRTGEIRRYDLERDIFFCQIPVAFDKNATCSNIERFIDDIVEPDTRQSLIDIPALAIYRRSSKDHWGAIGPPDSAKTTYGQLVRAFVGADNTCSISIQRLTSSPFASAGLEHKMLNLYDDLGQRKLFSLGDWNAMTGGGPVAKERKGVDLTSFDPYATHLYLANKMPRLDPNDSLAAFFRRMHVIRFPFVFTDNPTPNTNQRRRINDLIATLTTPEELSGFLNLVLERMPTVIDKGPHVPLDSNESMLQYMQSSDPAQAFIIECCQLDRHMMTAKSVMRDCVTCYCDENGLTPTGDKSLKEVMDSQGVFTYAQHIKDQPRTNWWVGIRIDPERFPDELRKRIVAGTKDYPSEKSPPPEKKTVNHQQKLEAVHNG